MSPAPDDTFLQHQGVFFARTTSGAVLLFTTDDGTALGDTTWQLVVPAADWVEILLHVSGRLDRATARPHALALHTREEASDAVRTPARRRPRTPRRRA